MSVNLLMVTAVCLLATTACSGQSPTGPSVPLDRQFTLAPGETASIQGTPLRVAFLRVSDDSRCPADAFCILGGDAVVHIRAESGGAAEHRLHTGDSSKGSATHGGFRIELVSLQPYPFSGRPARPDDYRATLHVTR